ncbi:MAG TPA: glycosyltransferase family 4 protein, partial [Chthoniobacterales bacterium]|nr:glycosyltransferase family 4 protein [Chthoniobacterales bacterium]
AIICGRASRLRGHRAQSVKIVVATVQTPFIHGGAEYLIQGLVPALAAKGHTVERVAMPFRFSPVEQVRRSMELWETEDLTVLNGHQVDRVICTQFPTYYLAHPRKATWLLHQYRAVYDLWETPFCAGFRGEPGTRELRDAITAADTQHLAECSPRYTIAANVSARLQRYNRISSAPIYHPPFMAEEFHAEPPEPFVFVPSRLEEAKRQDLLIRAMAHVRTRIIAVIAGDGGQKAKLDRLVAELGLEHCVKFIGRPTDEEKIGLYARSLCVFFGPYDEDYGYVTLEAMLAAKPVITCEDSGGPLEFVVAGRTGCIVPPDPQEIAAAIDELNTNRARAVQMGAEGRQRYDELEISWDAVVEKLTAA